MTQIHLYTAPANSGKTEFTLGRATYAAQQLTGDVIVCVATNEQAKQWRKRLAQNGGALGIHVYTFERLMRNILEMAGTAVTQITEPVQFRILRQILQDEKIDLTHYQPIREKLGLVQVLEALVSEFKNSLATPEQLSGIWTTAEPRLAEIGRLYTTYQTLLIENDWADNDGIGWLAIETLEQEPDLGRDWPLLIFDGFGSFTPLRRQVLRLLAQRVPEIIVTLTRSEGTSYRRFEEVMTQLEKTLGVAARPLPQNNLFPNSTLNTLCQGLFNPYITQQPADDSLTLIETATQAAEVRTALRWLKQQHLQHDVPLNEMVLISQDITAYESYIGQTAAEYGLLIRFVDGRPLGQNPAIDALLTLLKLFLPVSEEDPDPKIPYQQLQQVWSSPYFSWDVIGLEPQHVRGLARAAVARQITGRQSRWENELPKWGETENGQPEVAEKFTAFLKLTHAPQKATMRGYVIWLERLIGKLTGQPEENSLNIALQAKKNPPTADRDLAALKALKDVLRELLQSSELLQSIQLDYTDFMTDLLGIIDATRYQLPAAAEALTITSVVQARGLSFAMVALLGLAEGVFPATISEDPFLRDGDRERLRQAGVEIDDSTRSFEREYFYQMVGLPRQKLLLTRPTMTDDGAEWVPSAFWQEVQHVVDVTPISLPNGQPRTAAEAASLPELFTYLVEVAHQEAQQWVDAEHPEQMAQLTHSAQVLAIRQTSTETFSPHDGLLNDIETDLREIFGAEKVWSPTEFESYLTCPHFYFIGRVLKLSEPDKPDAELDVSHIGAIYHSLFQALYDAHGDDVAQAEENEIAHWLAELAPAVFAQAQRDLNFIPTAWWPQQQQEMVHTAVKSIVALEQEQAGYHTPRHEHRFENVPIAHPDDSDKKLRIKGRIDRIDVDNSGTARLIDYKTGGSYGYKKDIANSKKIQLVLYALAAQADPTLDVALVSAALYWHIRQAGASDVPVSDSDLMSNGLQTAWDTAERIQSGLFQPQVPDGGCPNYCPAAAFCWHYSPRF